ncbi:rhodanese-like domain-containing protein [Haladaptatus sp. DYF46]|uniref:rhodanese-like domain-containing protein n=1 Tax=Haladaptatus sp. DYF46 TaxID=2886041 RepID=UPI001E33B40A|nr:rhodanese-like domain-containing protein [Haladaptatus sp. DYF46]
MGKLRPGELDERLDDPDAPSVLDIRPREAYQSNHIDGSHNLPVYDTTTLTGGMSAWRGYRAGSLGYRLRSLLWRLF